MKLAALFLLLFAPLADAAIQQALGTKGTAKQTGKP